MFKSYHVYLVAVSLRWIHGKNTYKQSYCKYAYVEITSRILHRVSGGCCVEVDKTLGVCSRSLQDSFLNLLESNGRNFFKTRL